jgi:hypothetical protein
MLEQKKQENAEPTSSSLAEEEGIAGEPGKKIDINIHTQ